MNEQKIRPARPEDAEQLLAIYAPYVEKTAITFEYETPGADEMRRRVEATLARYPCLAAERDGRVVGYACAGPFKERAAYDWAVETTVYVAEKLRRSGVGRPCTASSSAAFWRRASEISTPASRGRAGTTPFSRGTARPSTSGWATARRRTSTPAAGNSAAGTT